MPTVERGQDTGLSDMVAAEEEGKSARETEVAVERQGESRAGVRRLRGAARRAATWLRRAEWGRSDAWSVTSDLERETLLGCQQSLLSLKGGGRAVEELETVK